MKKPSKPTFITVFRNVNEATSLLRLLLVMLTVLAFGYSNSLELTAQEPTTNVFLPAPRIVKQHLSRAKRAVEEEQFGDAVSHLGTILTHSFEEEVAPNADSNANQEGTDENQDYFVELEESPGTFVSLKGEAQRLLGSLPPQALEIYELQYGTEAKQILNASLSSGNISGLTEVTRKYFHTESGYESAILLAYRDLDNGHPLAAALNLSLIHI